MEHQNYKEFQFGWLLFVLIVPVHILFTYLFWYGIGDRPLTSSGFIISTLIFLIIYLLFYGMTTKITNDIISISFGIGLIHKRILIKKIVSVEPAEDPWYYGLGIRFIPHGMLYNIRGLHTVELKLHDTKNIIRIGTQNPNLLRQEIVKRMKMS